MLGILFVLCSAVVFASGADKYRGEECNIGADTGVCKLLNECQAARDAYVNHNIEPTICSWQGRQQVVCCVSGVAMANRNSAQRGPSSTTEYEPELPDYGDEDKKCPNLSPNITAPKTGRKAWDKCIEYQETYVYPCRMSVALNGDLTRQNYCHQGSDVLVLGGEDAAEFEFPHMVLLGYLEPQATKSSQVKWECAGSIISELFVLTAGHCTSHREYGSVRLIRTGTLDRSSVIKRQQVYWVAEIIKHPEYASPSKYNDIALLKIQKPIQLDSSVLPACLDSGRGVTYDRALISGWGDTRQGGGQADRLQKVILTKFPTSQCRRWYGKDMVRNMEQGYLDDRQLCYGDQKQLDDIRNGVRPNVDYKDACQGDSGGPAQVKNSVLGCMYTIVGLTSFGKGCGNAPGIYTRVSRYVPWIESIVWPDS